MKYQTLEALRRSYAHDDLDELSSLKEHLSRLLVRCVKPLKPEVLRALMRKFPVTFLPWTWDIQLLTDRHYLTSAARGIETEEYEYQVTQPSEAFEHLNRGGQKLVLDALKYRARFASLSLLSYLRTVRHSVGPQYVELTKTIASSPIVITSAVPSLLTRSNDSFVLRQAEARREDEARQRKAESERLAQEEKEASEKAANLAKAEAWAKEEARKKAAEEAELAAIEAEYAREAEAKRLENERSAREAKAKEEQEQAEATKKAKEKKASDERERLRLERLRDEERRHEEEKRAKLRAEERALANYDPAYVDALSGHDYEDYWRKLLTKRGASSVRWVGRDGSDGGADITFEWQGRRVAVQCKRTSSSVGVTALYEVTHGLKVYQCAVPWVVTNGSFTAPAERRASETGVVLVAGDPTVFLDSFFGVSDRVAA